MEKFSPENIFRAMTDGNLNTRFVANLTFAFNYYLHGLQVQGYHVVNIAIHIINAFLVFLFFHLTLKLPSNKEKYKHTRLLAYAVALLWLVHPLATQSVTYLVQRMNSLAVMFYLLAMVCYIKTRLYQLENSKTKFSIVCGFLLCFLFGVLALGSKENAATLPLMILIYELFFFQDFRVQFSWRNISFFFFFILIFVGFIFYFLGSNPWHILTNPCTGRDFTAYERQLTEFRVIIHYISLIVFPAPERLTFDYDFPLSTSLFQPISTFYSFVTIIGLAITAVITAQKERLLSFCIVAFFLTLAIESSVVCLEIIFEHRTYFPSVFLLMFLVACLYRITNNFKLFFLFILMVSILFGLWTFERNKIWHSHEIFWLDALKKSPEKPRVLTNTGNVYFNNKVYDRAELYYKKALSIKPDHRHAINNLIATYFATSQQEKAERYIKRGLELEPNWVDLLNALATIHVENKEYNKAIRLLRKSLNTQPLYPKSNYHMGNVLLHAGRPKPAIFFLIQAAASQPENISYLLKLAEAFTESAQIPKAINIYEKILLIDPNHIIAHSTVARLLTPYNSKLARSHYEQVVKFSPYSVPALYNLANILFREGENDKAKEFYARIISITPELANAYNNLGLLLLKEGKNEEAILIFKKALQIVPSHKLALSNLKDARKTENTNKTRATD